MDYILVVYVGQKCLLNTLTLHTLSHKKHAPLAEAAISVLHMQYSTSKHSLKHSPHILKYLPCRLPPWPPCQKGSRTVQAGNEYCIQNLSNNYQSGSGYKQKYITSLCACHIAWLVLKYVMEPCQCHPLNQFFALQKPCGTRALVGCLSTYMKDQLVG